MQGLFQTAQYAGVMTTKKGHLRAMREKAGLTLRELARQIGEHPSNVSYWERTSRAPRADLLVPMAKTLGVTVEELLGESGAPRSSAPGSKVRRLFDAVSRLPRRQQEKVCDILQPFVKEHMSEAATAQS